EIGVHVLQRLDHGLERRVPFALAGQRNDRFRLERDLDAERVAWLRFLRGRWNRHQKRGGKADHSQRRRHHCPDPESRRPSETSTGSLFATAKLKAIGQEKAMLANGPHLTLYIRQS